MKKIVIVFMISGFCLSSCVYDCVDSFQVINYSNEGQIIYYSCSDSINDYMNYYYDMIAGYNILLVNENVYIDKESEKYVRITFKKERLGCCKDGHARFFFISDSVFSNNPWDTIVKYQMYNRKLVYSKEDLKNMNWVIEYK